MPILLLYPTELKQKPAENHKEIIASINGVLFEVPKKLPPFPQGEHRPEPTPTPAPKKEIKRLVVANSNVVGVKLSRSQIEKSIVKWAVFYGVEPAKLLRVAHCESTTGQNPDAYNGKSGHFGLFQYLPSTWTRLSGKAGVNANILDDEAQAQVTAHAFSTGRGSEWKCQ